MARWFMGSLSASLAEAAEVPVTVVRIAGSEDETVTEAIANALTPGDKPVHYTQPQPVVEEARRPVVVGVDGSETSRRAFDFALEEARLHDAPLHVMFCWQLKDLGVIPGYENAVAPVKVGQRRAEEILSELMAKARIPDGVKVSTNAFHIPASKGLITASRYASHLVVGSRGLAGRALPGICVPPDRELRRMHGDRGALIHQNRHGVLTHASVMGLQGGILYSCNPITIYFSRNSEFIPRPPCSGAAAQ